MKFISNSEKETRILAGKMLRAARKRGVRAFLLYGNFGVGKTVFTQGVAKALGVKKHVRSPSFVLMQDYKGRKGNLVHVDCYRLKKIGDIGCLCMDQLMDEKCFLVVEWSERVPANMSKILPALSIRMQHGKNEKQRLINAGKHGIYRKRMMRDE
ncbi:tRNA (adenosine(37)-N6)-threonylcarbamoyltransferase complex ATPase subunit type 1 TsaE [Elusimicrobiota bacterium]